MSNLNSVQLQGNLVDDPRIMGTENKVARFTIAVNSGFGDNATTAFVDCVAFGKQVEVIEKHFSKGKQIIVRGGIQQNRWEDDEGNKRSKLEVRLESYSGFFFTSGGGSGTSEPGEPAATAASGEGEGKLF